MASKNPTTKLKADISEFTAKFEEAKRTIRLANSEFKAATGGMDNWAKSADGLAAKIDQLNKVHEAEKKKLESLEGQYQAVVKEQGKDSEGAQDLLNKINNQKAAVERCEKNLRNYNEKLEKSRSASQQLTDTIDKQEDELKKLKDKYADVVLEQGKGSDAAKDLKGDIEKLSGELKKNKDKLNDAKGGAEKLDKAMSDSSKSGGGISKYQVALGNLISAGITKAISGLKNAARETVETWQSIDEGQDAMIKKTGATGAEAEKLKKVYNNVASSVKGDFGDIGNAIGDIKTRFNFDGTELENATVAFMKYAELNNTDVTSSIDTVARAMGDAGIDLSDYSSILDTLTATSQKTGIGVDKLAESMTKYGAPMRAVGMDAEETIALFGQWEKAGVNTEIAMSGVKKAIGTWGKAGKDGREEFKKTLDEIGKCPDIASATTKAIEVFGQKAGPDLADAIQGGRFNYSQLLEEIKDSKGTVKDTYKEVEDAGDKIAVVIQKIKVKIADFVKKFLNKHGKDIEKGIDKIFKGGEKVVKWIGQHKSEVLTTLKTVAGAVAAIWVVDKVKKFVDTIGLVKTALGALSGPVGIATLAAGAIGAVAWAIAKAETPADRLKERMKKLKDAYKDWKDEKKGLYDDTTAEFGYYDDLWQELQNIVDVNGHIKTGYENRASYISNELSKATDTEITINGNVVESYEKIRKEIEKTLAVKKGEAFLSADDSAYSEAVGNKNDYANDVAEASKKLDKEAETISKLQQAQKSKKSITEFFKNDKKILSEIDETADAYNLSRAEALYVVMDNHKTERENAETELKEAQSKYSLALQDIANHEALVEAVTSGSVDSINGAITDLQNSFLTADYATKEMLDQQEKEFKSKYNNIKYGIKNGIPGFTEAMATEAKQALDRATEEVKRAETKEAVDKKLDETKSTVKEKAPDIPDAFTKAWEAGTENGINAVDGYFGAVKTRVDYWQSKFNELGIFGSGMKAHLMSNVVPELNFNQGTSMYGDSALNTEGKVYNVYNQTINSPSPVSARDIAMQSKNMFNYKKGKK